jgi:tRNA-specific 2-thiouridylase
MAVRRIEAGTRRIVIGPRQAASREVVLRDMNWLMPPPHEPIPARVKLRAGDAMRGVEIVPGETGATLVLDEPALAAPGQAAVIYEGTRVLGGGYISK